MTTITAPTAAADPAQWVAWLGILHAATPGHLHICSTGDWTGHTYPTNQLDQAAAYIAQLDGREGIYLRITSLKEPLAPGRRGGATDSASLPALWADLDIAGPGHAEQDLPPDETAARQVITTSGLPDPSIWIHSGGGLYPIWLLDQPWQLTDSDQLDAAKALAKDWQAVIEHAAASHGWRYGRGVGDLARVLRIPGTINRKEGLARPCRIIGGAGYRYTTRHLTDALAAAKTRIAPEPATTVGSSLITPNRDRRPGEITPLDDFNARATWTQVLGPAGWREHYRADDVTYWTRPGKQTGISASTNALGTDRLHVFTTGAAPLDGGESYSKAGTYAALHYGGDHHAAAKQLARQGFGTPLPEPGADQAQLIADILGPTPATSPAVPAPVQQPADPPAPTTPPAPAAPAETPIRIWAPEVDVTTTAVAADWLREEAGRGRLAGLFIRHDQVVHTPREGEDGYIPLTANGFNNDGPAQIRAVNDSTLASRITFTYGCYRIVKRDGKPEPVQATFPRGAARISVDVPDMLPNLRHLRGVIHTPLVRADGTLLVAPGYDPGTGLLHLPEPGLTVPAVPDQPAAADVAAAVALVDEMLAGFPFVNQHYKANYIGNLLTPLLRAVCPPPYKMHAVEAHQPGSGKTLLAQLSRHIHGGVFRAELPEDDAELRKQITAILTVTTGSVVILDNVAGKLQSSTLAGLLTADVWDDRPLGATAITRASNDRLWTITGNNLAIGGDLPRRTIRTVIDPQQPNPELRTGFAIPNLEEWVIQRRGELLHALLAIIRAWVVAGRPLPPERASDGYSRWTRTVEGIVTHAGIGGQFDHPSTRVDLGTDDDDWAMFLAAVHRAYGVRKWTAKELLADVDTGNLMNPAPIPADALPDELAAKAARAGRGPVGIAKSLGWWLRNREGRWAGGLAVRCVGEASDKAKLWQIRTEQDTE
ncbi:hypothetical protein EDC02_5916 [Micromonospora sp. Llam0]|uniref:hypothetical protein n=1 Tax=Micromonospora sp. Llam0 TaxID=2485143 RepID=UPI000F491A2C|nr:hypothetical protein [Micromonospora sp. Llam0]ROO51052.1 hypothetical protein EDC02_5916 [Micromonospora sp. Llam0]